MKLAVFNDPHRGFSTKTSLLQDKVFESIDQSTVDAVLVVGDWGTTKTDHVRGAFKAFRKAFPDKPIMGVLGNHDFWDPHGSIVGIQNLIARYASESNIHLLELNPLEIGNVLFMGFNGWFAHTDPQQEPKEEDMYLMGEPRRGKRIRPFVDGVKTDFYFRKKAEEGLEFILKQDPKGKKTVVASHFPCVLETMGNQVNHCGNPEHGKKLIDKGIDYLFFGHTHEYVDLTINKTRIVNVGSGYQEVGLGVKEFFFYKVIEI